MTELKRFADIVTDCHTTVDELIKGKGTQFDPNIVEAFMTLVEKNGHAKYERMYSDDGGTEQPTSNA